MHSPSRGEIEDMAGKIAYFLRKKLEIPEDARVAVICLLYTSDAADE